MPNEPAESDFKTKVQATAYPTQERNGIVWAYMGPRATPPPLPDFEANMLGGGDEYVISIIHRPCNWMQGWEGEMDTVHQAFLHSGAMQVEDTAPGTFDYYITSHRAGAAVRHRHAVRDVVRRSRPAGEDRYYWRIAHMLFPFFAMIPAGAMGSQIALRRLRADGRRAHAALGDRQEPGRPGRPAARGARQRGARAAAARGRPVQAEHVGLVRPLQHGTSTPTTTT